MVGDHFAHGVRHRAGELITVERGPQTALDAARKPTAELDAERLTQLDRMLIAEQRDSGVAPCGPTPPRVIRREPTDIC